MRSNFINFYLRVFKPLLILIALNLPFSQVATAGAFAGSLNGNAEKKADRTITGKVSGQDGASIPGVNVVLKGTQRGTSTNSAGQYSIDVTGDNPVLVFSFVGYILQEVQVNNRSVVDVSLIANTENLNEVTVTALGIKREDKSLGYSVGKVDGKEFNRVSQENVLNAMAGKVAGVAISSTGATGSSVSMVIRGAKSLSNDNQPLFRCRWCSNRQYFE